ncbi:MAG: hypothetical protein SFY32_09955 [Bacteroidota bacterium]|nr:hypothetical protein [Bacteroidota bacterium]
MNPNIVRKTTFEQDLKDKEMVYINLSPIERIKLNTELNKRMYFDIQKPDSIKLVIKRK